MPNRGLAAGRLGIVASAALFIAGAAAWAASDNPGPEIRAQLRAYQSTVLSAQVTGRIQELPFREGEAVRKGQKLVAIDCSTWRAALDQAEAEEHAAAKVAEADVKLARLGSIGTVELESAIAKQKSAKAQLDYQIAMVRRCVVVAPFSGRVGIVKVRRWQSVAEGAELMDLVDDRKLETAMIVPSRWLAWLKPGTHFTIAVDELNRTIDAEVVRRGAEIDPVSQTVIVYGRVLDPPKDLAPGMSGKVGFNQSK